MGSFRKFMAFTTLFTVLSLFLIPTKAQEVGFISAVISSKGLDFTKDLLIQEAISSIIPLQLPQIEKSVKIPLIGQVDVALSNITIYSVDIASSYVETGDSGIALVASGATANLSMHWQYSYTTWLFEVSDNGAAFIQVEGMEVGVTLALKDQQGSLKLSVLDCGCYVKDISIKLDGGASWLYQGIVDAFGGQIVSAVEENISKKVKEGITKLDSSLQSLPKQIELDDIAALNVTLVDNPVLSNSSIEFQINGLFTAPIDDSISSLDHKGSLDPLPRSAPAKMVEISLHEDVFNSVSLVYFNANYMNWIINKIPDQSLLNTAGWRYIIPRLYKQYPNKDMDLNVTVSSQPIITVVNNGIDITVYSDVTIDVIDNEVIPVACISMHIHASCTPEILRNKLAGDQWIDLANDGESLIGLLRRRSGIRRASSGIGVETARILALRGVHVIMAVRNIDAGTNVKEAILKEIPSNKIDVMELDLSSLASVRKFAAEYNSKGLPLNILINNAGVMADKFKLSQDNIELDFATNHLGHFLLTNLLLDNMKHTSRKSSIEGRIVNVSSFGHRYIYREGIRFDSINDESRYNKYVAYAESKLANILHANELTRRLKEERVEITANSLHPGTIRTNIMHNDIGVKCLLKVLRILFLSKTIQQGAATTCFLALNPQVKGVSGEYYADCNIAKPISQANDADLAKRLWDFSLSLTNLK